MSRKRTHDEIIESGDYISLPELLTRIGSENLCPPNEGMTVRQAAKKKGVSMGTIKRHLRTGKIPFKYTVNPITSNLEYRIFNLFNL